MAEEKVLNQLVINYLTDEQYNEALKNGQIKEDEIYMTPDEDEESGGETPTIESIPDSVIDSICSSC